MQMHLRVRGFTSASFSIMSTKNQCFRKILKILLYNDSRFYNESTV
jgi:hypothetical protein